MTGETQKNEFNPHHALWAGMASVAVVAFLIVIKAFAYASGGSTGVLAALIDSITDAAASIMSLLAIHISLKPADNHHRYGHGKIEGLSALGQAIFILVAAVFLAFEAADRFLHPVELGGQGLGIVVMLVSIALSAVLVMVQRASLRGAPSLAVKSDLAHYGSDIIVNIAVVVVLVVQMYGGPDWLDPALGFGVALWLVRIAKEVATGGFDMLLDREIPDDERNRILDCVRGCRDVHGVHDLRTRMVGMNLNISFDIEVDPDLSLRAAHDIARSVEHCLLQRFPHAEIMIHVDPLGETEDGRHSAGIHTR